MNITLQQAEAVIIKLKSNQKKLELNGHLRSTGAISSIRRMDGAWMDLSTFHSNKNICMVHHGHCPTPFNGKTYSTVMGGLILFHLLSKTMLVKIIELLME
jgi:hypothetical protein